MADAVGLCVTCGVAPRRTAHRNTRHCDACRRQLLRAPASRVTPEHGREIARLAGAMTRRAIAQTLGISQARVHRWLKEQGMHSNARDYPKEVVDAVCLAYGVLGKVKTQELFPDVHIRSITDRYYHGPPRQVRWTGDHILEAVRMAGIVSHTAQAAWFGRPNAYNGSIKSLWTKRLRCAPKDVHGLSAHLAWQICRPGTPAVLVHQQVMPGPRLLVLWVDMVQHLKTDVDPTVASALATLAHFQQWLFGPDAHAAIEAMILEREDTRGLRGPG